jgi:hypothetical protein
VERRPFVVILGGQQITFASKQSGGLDLPIVHGVM